MAKKLEKNIPKEHKQHAQAIESALHKVQYLKDSMKSTTGLGSTGTAQNDNKLMQPAQVNSIMNSLKAFKPSSLNAASDLSTLPALSVKKSLPVKK